MEDCTPLSHTNIVEDQIGACAFRLMLHQRRRVVHLRELAPSIAWVVPAVGSHARAGVDQAPPPAGCLWGVGSDRYGAYMGEWALLRTMTEALEHARKLLIQWDAVARLGAPDEGLPMWWTRPADDVRDKK
jgi:hypothetical protein